MQANTGSRAVAISRLGAAAVCLVAIAMAACQSEVPTPSAQPSSTLALPTLPPGEGPCAGKGLQGAVVRVDPADPNRWWVEHDQGQIDLVWPVGATTDGSSVRDRQGVVLATADVAVEFVCDLPDGDPRAFLP